MLSSSHGLCPLGASSTHLPKCLHAFPNVPSGETCTPFRATDMHLPRGGGGGEGRSGGLQGCEQPVSLAAGDSSQDEAEEDVKQITVSSSPRVRVWAEGQQGHFAAQWSGEQGAGASVQRVHSGETDARTTGSSGPSCWAAWRDRRASALLSYPSGGQDGGPACVGDGILASWTCSERKPGHRGPTHMRTLSAMGHSPV